MAEKKVPIKLKWSSSREIRQSLGTLQNMMLNDRISTDKLRAASYTANILLQALKSELMEEQIKLLEEKIRLLEEDDDLC